MSRYGSYKSPDVLFNDAARTVLWAGKVYRFL